MNTECKNLMSTQFQGTFRYDDNLNVTDFFTTWEPVLEDGTMELWGQSANGGYIAQYDMRQSGLENALLIHAENKGLQDTLVWGDVEFKFMKTGDEPGSAATPPRQGQEVGPSEGETGTGTAAVKSNGFH